MSSWACTGIRAVDVRFQFRVQIRNPDEKLHKALPLDFLRNPELSLPIFLLVLYGVIGIFFRFRRFASTMVALPSFLGESVPDGGK